MFFQKFGQDPDGIPAGKTLPLNIDCIYPYFRSGGLAFLKANDAFVDVVAGSEERLARVASLLAHGQASLVSQSLLPALDLRAAGGDRECELAAAALRLALASGAPTLPPAPRPEDALSAALDRLVALVKRQEEQIRDLQSLLETTL